MEDTSNISAVVLAGGLSRRLGRDKAFEPIGNLPLIQRVLSQVSQISRHTIVVANDKKRETQLSGLDGISISIDKYPDTGSLGGIFTGIHASTTDWTFVVACDMPFLNIKLIRYIMSLKEGYDAVVPVIDGRPEPIHSIYSKDCLEHIEEKIDNNELKITGFFDKISVRYVNESAINEFDPDHLSFLNVNNEEDLEKAINIANR